MSAEEGYLDSESQKGNRNLFRDWAILGLTAVAAIVLLSLFPTKVEPTISTSTTYLIEMAQILPAVMVLMGLFKVWISKEMVVKYLGEASGFKGILIAALLGSTLTGPLYVAFPLALAMRDKGARIMNIIIFLSAWACIKIPQEMIEIQFLGLKFMLTRLVLTIVLVSIMGFVIEQVMKDRKSVV